VAKQAVETERITDPEIVIDRTAVKAEARVEIKLLSLGESPGAAAIEQLRGALVIIVCDVLDEDVAMRTEFSL
jgi:hypothetical protein